MSTMTHCVSKPYSHSELCALRVLCGENSSLLLTRHSSLAAPHFSEGF
jgi:hypothetical protein